MNEIRSCCWALVFAAVAVSRVCMGADSIEAARAARDEAKLELIRAQRAFDRADDAYIEALRGGASKTGVSSSQPGAAAPAVAGLRPGIVTFAMSGPGAIETNPLDYRARLTIDGEEGAWTQTASGVRVNVPAGTRSLAYEVQGNPGDAGRPRWSTLCKGDLPVKPETLVDIVIEKRIVCRVR